MDVTTLHSTVAVDPSQVPDWATAYAQECRDLFGLAEWKIYLTLADQVGKNGQADGNVDLDTRYLTATITLRRGMTAARTRAVLMHEHLHLVLGHLVRIGEQAIDQLDDQARAVLNILFRDAEEQTIERLVRALQATIKPSQQED